jgi:hypothetical protein
MDSSAKLDFYVSLSSPFNSHSLSYIAILLDLVRLIQYSSTVYDISVMTVSHMLNNPIRSPESWETVSNLGRTSRLIYGGY